MVQITKIKGANKAEYVNESEIIRCWPEKAIDKKESYRGEPCWIDFCSEKFLQLKKIDENLNYTLYEDKDGTKYVSAWGDGIKFYPEDYLHVGWSKVIVIPEESHTAYFLEKKSHNVVSDESKVYCGRYKTTIKDSEIIEVDEATFKRVIGV